MIIRRRETISGWHPSYALSQIELPRKRFRRDEVQRIADAGILDHARYELIDGDLIEKMGQKPPHASAMRALLEILAATFGLGRVQTQLPIEIAVGDQQYNEPEPDLAVFASESRAAFHDRHPRGDELALIVEVADATIRLDSTKKRDLYARAGVPEYWVLDVNGRRLVAFRGLSEGQYQESVTYAEDEALPLPISKASPATVRKIFE